MSKLVNTYKQLKSKDKDTVYLIRVGIFYNILNEDALLVSEKIGLKVTDLSPNIIKCGFPIAQIDKYKAILEEKNVTYQVIDNLPNSSVENYLNDVEVKKVLKQIESLDMNDISYHQAYDILLDIQNKLKNKPISN